MGKISIKNFNYYSVDLVNNKRETLDVFGDESMDVSDGYHTFKELYDHRITLFIALCKSLRQPYAPDIWRSKYHSDGELAFGGAWFVLGVLKEKGKQITYHLPIDHWEETNFAETLDKAPDWDGHTSGDVLERLKSL